MKTTEGGDAFDWEVLVPHVVHPMKVAIIEAMSWIGRPLSASELDKIFDDQFGVSQVSYHVRTLAKIEAIEEAGHEQVRGAWKTSYAVASPGIGTAPPADAE